jgi:WD40 repeat protein
VPPRCQINAPDLAEKLSSKDFRHVHDPETDTQAAKLVLTGHKWDVHSLEKGSTSFFSSSSDGTICMWDLVNFECQFVFSGHTAPVKTLGKSNCA